MITMVGKNKMLAIKNLGGGEPPDSFRSHTMFSIRFKTLVGWPSLAGCAWLAAWLASWHGCLATFLAAGPCSAGRPLILLSFF